MPEVTAVLILQFLDVLPATVYDEVGIGEATTWNKGDFIAPSSLRRPQHGWRMATSRVLTDTPEEILKELLGRLRSHQPVLSRAIKAYGCDARFALNIYAYPSRMPIVRLTNQVINEVASYGATFDADIITLV